MLQFFLARFMEPGVIVCLGGVLPFGSIFIEMWVYCTSRLPCSGLECLHVYLSCTAVPATLLVGSGYYLTTQSLIISPWSWAKTSEHQVLSQWTRTLATLLLIHQCSKWQGRYFMFGCFTGTLYSHHSGHTRFTSCLDSCSSSSWFWPLWLCVSQSSAPISYSMPKTTDGKTAFWGIPSVTEITSIHDATTVIGIALRYIDHHYIAPKWSTRAQKKLSPVVWG